MSKSMRTLYAPQRHNSILARARAQGRVEVNDLAEQLGVTPETIRRDLTALERLGQVRRVHGGALPIVETAAEPTFLERLGRFAQEKERIAARALAELPAQGTILLDSGTTTLALAKALPPDLDVEIVTNSVTVAALLMDLVDQPVHILGGTIRRRTGASVGPWSVAALADLAVDVAFIGTNGFTPERGLTTPVHAEAATKRAMVESARRAVVLADSSKAGQVRLHRFAKLEEIAALITDSGLDDDTAHELDAAGMEVIRA